MGANFLPNKNTLTRVETFDHWCQQVLPLVYDESLSYYELLCKVTEILNRVIENGSKLGNDVSGLHKAYVQLQEYVNTYFENLDVESEINRKLDIMASDGVLSALIEPLFNTYKGEIDGELAVLKGRMNVFTSLGEGSTTGDAELQDIRVDYKGIQHESAGNAVRAQVGHLSGVINNLIVTPQSFDYMDWDGMIFGKYLNPNGAYTETNGHWCSGYIDVDPNSTYCFSIIGTLEKVYMANILFYDATTDTIISSVSNAYTFTTPENCYRIRCTRQYLGKDGTQGANTGITENNYSNSVFIRKTQLQKGDTPSIAERKYLSDSVEVKAINNTWFSSHNVLAYGDSLVEQNKWQPYVKTYFSIPTFWNGGIGGTTIANNGKRTTLWDGSEINGWMCGDDRINLLANTYTPEFVLIFAGHNDWSDSIPIGEIGDTLVDSNFKSAYALMIKKLQTIYPSIPIVAMTPVGGRLTVSGVAQDIECRNSIGLTMTDYANATKEVCQRYGISCIDVNAESGINVLNGNTYLNDVIHVNDLGGKKVASAVVNGLKRFMPIEF